MGRDIVSSNRLVATSSQRSFVERRRHRRHSALESAASFELAQLEARLLYCLDGSSPNHVPGDEHGNLPVQVAGPFVTAPTGPQLAGSPLSSIPALNSLASAGAKLYLDFVGAAAMNWGGYNVPSTPAFDQDGDASTFSSGELDSIRQIWARVAEAYSPFNINVTTTDPGNLNDGQTLKVVVGGSGSWLGAAAGGVSYVGSFTNGLPNVAWVFPSMLANGNVKYTGDATIHESGHSFGLLHQSAYSGTSKTAEYRGGTSLVAPYMGSSYYSTRGKWSNGQSSASYSSYQDDLAIIAANPFGYRADDHGDTIGTADALDVSGATVTGAGVITRISDVDAFSFVTSAGPVSFTVNVAQYGAMLDATLKLVDVNGNVVATSDTANLGETITANVAGGAYRLLVSSKGVYGDVGQYTISGTIVPSPYFVAAPSNVTTAPGAGGVTVNWYDNAWNETGHGVQRSDDGGATWNTVGSVAANVRTYLDSSAVVGHTYQYRVYSFNDTDQSGNSAAATVAFTPATPGALHATSLSASQVGLTWNDVDGETGYVLERSTNGTTWTQIGTPGADSTGYTDSGLVAGTRYFYRLRATSSVGASANTASADTTTRALQPALSLTVISAGQINLAWTNVLGETGYRLERSTNGTDWSTVATTGANVVSYSNTGLSANAQYYYRVVAINGGGDSGAGTAGGTTLMAAPVGLTANAVSTTEIDLTWTDSSGETGYRLERSTDEKTWALVTTLSADATSYNNMGLTAGTRYLYRLRAVNAGGASAPTANVSATTVCLTPGLTGVAFSNTQANLSWSNVLGETGYVLQRSDNGTDAWTTVVSPLANVVTYGNAGLSVDTTYYYRVMAHNSAGDSAASNVVAVHTLMGPPSGLTATAVSTTEVDLAWTDLQTETGYKVERSIDERTWTLVATLGADVTAFNNTGLVAGTRYLYRVRALNAGGASAPTANVGTFTIPLAPALVRTVMSDGQVNLSWSNVLGETNYVLERSANGTDGWTTVASPLANVVSFANTGLAADTDYFYRVTAHNASGDSASSAVVAAHTLLPAVTGLTTTNVGTTQVDLTWDDSTGESGYVVERYTGTKWLTVGTTAADVHAFSNAGLVAGTTYFFRVHAVNAGGSSLTPTYTTIVTRPLGAAVTAQATGATQVKLSWTNVVGETGYRVERSPDGANDWTLVTTAGANVIGFTDAGLTTDTPYFYRVTAFNGSGDAAVSSTATTRTLLVAPAGLTAIATSTSQVNLSWADSTGETAYVVERSLNGGLTWAALTTLAADVTSYSNTGLVAGTAYTYRVRAANAGGNSEPGLKATATTAPAGVSVGASTVSAGQINVSWTNVLGETGYRIERSTDNASWSTVATTGANVISFANAGLTADTLYYYRVTAFNGAGDGVSGVSSRRTVLAAPGGLTVASTTATSATLTWGDAGGDLGYKVDRWTGTTWALIATVGADVNTYVNTGLIANRAYYYRVRAVNAGGDSAASNTALAVTPAAAQPVKGKSVFQTRRAIADLVRAA